MSHALASRKDLLLQCENIYRKNVKGTLLRSNAVAMEIPWYAGIFLLIGLVVFIYFIKSTNSGEAPPKTKVNVNASLTDPRKEDIVLAEITEQGKESDYGILWNGQAGKTYPYVIKDASTGEIVAESTAESKTNVFKIKGLPIEIGTTYQVTVGDEKTRATIEIPFIPLSFDLHSLNYTSNHIDCNTDAPPTNIEIIINGVQKIPISELQIKMEPPGFIVNHRINERDNVTIMIYNGRNTANILNLPARGDEGDDSPPGQTLVPF